MKTKFLLSALLLSVGCARVPSSWAKHGATREQYVDDKQYCELYSTELSRGANGHVHHIQQTNGFVECMEERGWKPQN